MDLERLKPKLFKVVEGIILDAKIEALDTLEFDGLNLDVEFKKSIVKTIQVQIKKLQARRNKLNIDSKKDGSKKA